MSDCRKLVLHRHQKEDDPSEQLSDEIIDDEDIHLNLPFYIRHIVDHLDIENKRYIDDYVMGKIELDIIHKLCIKVQLSEKDIRSKIDSIMNRGFECI